jgi:hypothetical protein
MSTRSCIIVRVKDEDLGKIKKFRPTFLPTVQASWSSYNEEDVNDKSGKITLNTPYIGIYCHNDGYIEGVGNALKEKYNDYKTALNLVLGGDCSFVSLDGVRRYATRNGEKWECVKPTRGINPKCVSDNIDYEYCYLFENGKWKVRHGCKNKFKCY